MNEDLDSIFEAKSELTTKDTKANGFFSFHTMIGPILIKVIYVLGMIGCTILGIMIMRYKTLIGIAVIIFGNLIWRIICESWILLFSMHDILCSIEKKVRKK